ncbi:Ribonucleotide reductase transcriptional regulator NrdR [Lachnospiraceae bacterium TWA4]|nr:Ribonucleotide reductase transcriptional regulator NrdR [Lachnospiraceae bacterium TWA4]
MKCPYCDSDDTRVINSRPAEDGSAIRRRRHCDVCGRRFTTYEKVETIPFMVIKKDNTREPFDRAKIEKGILNACHKRAVSLQQIEKMVLEIETQIFEAGDKEVTSTYIGELVMEKLRLVDEVAYVRFASVYREFKDATTFLLELEKLNWSKEN